MGGSFKWPSVPEVVKYRQEVRKAILDIIDSVPLKLPVTQDDSLVSLTMLAVSVDVSAVSVLCSTVSILLTHYHAYTSNEMTKFGHNTS